MSLARSQVSLSLLSLRRLESEKGGLVIVLMVKRVAIVGVGLQVLRMTCINSRIVARNYIRKRAMDEYFMYFVQNV